jgi:hypothetical protein
MDNLRGEAGGSESRFPEKGSAKASPLQTPIEVGYVNKNRNQLESEA